MPTIRRWPSETFILGSGGLSSRLADRVRQKDGLSYTVQSNLQPSAVDERTSFYVFAISNPANAGKLQDAIAEELKRLVADGITQEELDQAKDGYLQSLQVARTDENSLIPMLEAYAFIGRDMKYVADFESKIRNLTVEDVNAAIKKAYQPGPPLHRFCRRFSAGRLKVGPHTNALAHFCYFPASSSLAMIESGICIISAQTTSKNCRPEMPVKRFSAMSKRGCLRMAMSSRLMIATKSGCWLAMSPAS